VYLGGGGGAGGACSVEVNLSRKLKSRYGARNRFLEPSLELRSQATWAGGPVQQPYAYLVPSPHSGTKVTDTVLFITVSEHCAGALCADCTVLSNSDSTQKTPLKMGKSNTT
jgi:hypothetical protein